MPYQPGQGKTAVALFVDGLELKFIQLSTKGGRVTLRDYKTVALIQKFEEKPGVGGEELAETPDMSAEAFGEPAAPTGMSEQEGQTNASVLLSVLTDLPSSKYTLSYALSEPAVTYQEFESDAGLKGMKLKKHMAQELSAMRSAAPALDALDFIPTAQGGLLSVVREDGMHIYDLLQEIKPFIGNRLPKINLIDSADAALLGLVRASYEFQDEDVSVLVYVGNDFSRLIFMQGKNYLHFAPIISEGYGSSNIENTIYSRILLEQDNIALARIDRIILCGESHKVNLRESLAPQFTSATVDYLKAPDLDLSVYEGVEVGESISEYAIPIATAWCALAPKKAGFYPLNLCPDLIIEGQKAFKLAWHGWLAALLIVGSIVFFITSIQSRSAEIKRQRAELVRKKADLADLEKLRARRAELSADIDRYSKAATVYDSIAPGSDRWSRVLHYVANSVEDLNSLWITHMGRDEQSGALIINGRSVYRTRISRLASLFEKAILKQVRTTAIRNKVVYEFDLVVEQIDKSDVGPITTKR